MVICYLLTRLKSALGIVWFRNRSQLTKRVIVFMSTEC